MKKKRRKSEHYWLGGKNKKYGKNRAKKRRNKIKIAESKTTK